MVDASFPPGPEKSAARPTTPSDSKDALAAKRNGRIAWLLVAALLAVFCYFDVYRPNRERQALHELSDAARALGHPAQWDGVEGLARTAPFAIGEFETTFAAGTDPIASLLEWLHKLDSPETPADADQLRYQCFSPGVRCTIDFDFGRYKGTVRIYYQAVAPTPAAKGHYELWLPE